jgi:hypothetical protein
MENHSYSLSDIETMMPWEREIYVNLLIEQMKKIAEERKAQQGI